MARIGILLSALVTVTYPIPRKSPSEEETCWGAMSQTCQEKMSHTGTGVKQRL